MNLLININHTVAERWRRTIHFSEQERTTRQQYLNLQDSKVELNSSEEIPMCLHNAIRFIKIPETNCPITNLQLIPVERWYSDWAVRGSNPSRCGTFNTRPDRPWDLPSPLYNGYRVSFPGVKRWGRCVNRPLPSSAEVKERVQLYLYSQFGPSWSVLR